MTESALPRPARFPWLLPVAIFLVVMAALLVNQPNSLNILPLYVVLMMVWVPFVLWLVQRNPWQALVLRR